MAPRRLHAEDATVRTVLIPDEFPERSSSIRFRLTETSAFSDGAARRVIPRDEAQSPAPWRSQPCHAFAEPSGYRRSRKDMARSAAEYRRTLEESLGNGRTRH